MSVPMFRGNGKGRGGMVVCVGGEEEKIEERLRRGVVLVPMEVAELG